MSVIKTGPNAAFKWCQKNLKNDFPVGKLHSNQKTNILYGTCHSGETWQMKVNIGLVVRKLLLVFIASNL